MDDMDSANPDLNATQVWYNQQAVPSLFASVTNVFEGDSTTVVTTINGNAGAGASGPSVTFSGGSTGYEFIANAGTVSLAVDNAATARTSIGAAASGINTDITELNGASQVDVTARYEVNGVQVVTDQQAAVPDAAGGVTVDTEARVALNALLAALRVHGLIDT